MTAPPCWVAADCSAFSRADFHARFMAGRITAIGCPKLDEGDYTEKLTEILRAQCDPGCAGGPYGGPLLRRH